MVGFVAVIFLAVLWQPDRQVRLHQLHFLRSLEKRDWPRFATFVSEQYSDRWQHDKAFLLREPREVFRQFIVLGIEQEERSLFVAGGKGRIAAKLTITGNGGPFAELAKQRVNALAEPFTFRWVKQSWKPWDWQLVEVDQPELVFPERLDVF